MLNFKENVKVLTVFHQIPRIFCGCSHIKVFQSFGRYQVLSLSMILLASNLRKIWSSRKRKFYCELRNSVSKIIDGNASEFEFLYRLDTKENNPRSWVILWNFCLMKENSMFSLRSSLKYKHYKMAEDFLKGSITGNEEQRYLTHTSNPKSVSQK